MPLPFCDCSADSGCNQINSYVIAWQLHARSEAADWGKACYRSQLDISLQTRLHDMQSHETSMRQASGTMQDAVFGSVAE